jgi:C-terminal region of MMR_HSR1 domain
VFDCASLEHGCNSDDPAFHSQSQGNRRYVRCLYVYNKVDMLSIEEVDEIARRPDSLPVSCQLSLNMDSVLKNIWEMMGLVRVYTKKVCNYFMLACALRPHARTPCMHTAGAIRHKVTFNSARIPYSGQSQARFHRSRSAEQRSRWDECKIICRPYALSHALLR